MTDLPLRGSIEISIILPALNERRNIREALSALTNQKTDRSYEVIVVDSSKDGTADIVRTHFPKVRLVSSQTILSCGEAKNLGLLRVQGKKILFTDADVRVPEDWIERMSTYLDSFDVVGGSFVNGTPRSLLGTVGYLLEFFRVLPERKSTMRMDPSFVIGGNSGYRKKVIGDRRFIPEILEDIVFSHEILKVSSKAVYDPSLSVLHLNRTGFKKVFTYQTRLGEGAYGYRKMLGLRPHSFLKYPALIFLVPPYTLLTILTHLFRSKNFKIVPFFLLISPLVLVANYWWAYGYARAGRAAKAMDR